MTMISLAEYKTRIKQLYIDAAKVDADDDTSFAIADAFGPLLELFDITDDIEDSKSVQ
jgi:hypothetical protein